MLRLLKVSGISLYPSFQDGDYVLTSRIPILFHSLRPGDVVAFRQATYGTLIKIVQRIEQDQVFVTGLHETSVDSRRFGPVSYHEMIGKVIWHIRKPGR